MHIMLYVFLKSFILTSTIKLINKILHIYFVSRMFIRENHISMCNACTILLLKLLFYLTRGVGIKMTHPLYEAPCLDDVLPDLVFAQNLPSIVCGLVLDPQPGETVIDMCASPGGKTNHIASLMKDQVELLDICLLNMSTRRS